MASNAAAVAAPETPRAAYHEYRLALGTNTANLSAGQSFLSDLVFAAPGLLVTRSGGATPVPLRPSGVPFAAPGIELGFDASAATAIPSQTAGGLDLVATDPAADRLVRMQWSKASGWQQVSTLPTGSAPAALALTAVAVGVVEKTGIAVADAGSDDVSLFAPDSERGMSAAGTRATGARPVAIAASYLGGLGQTIITANAGAGSVTALSGKDYAQRQDVVLGGAPAAVTTLQLDRDLDDQGAAVASTGATGGIISVLVPTNQGLRVKSSMTLPASKPVALAAGQLNRDTKDDLAIADAATRTVKVFYGDGKGRFVHGPTLPLPDDPVAIAVGAFGGDEADDIAVIGHGGILSVFIAGGDRLLSEQPAAQVTALHGRVVWSAPRQDGGYGLIARYRGVVGPLPVAGASNAIASRLGVGPTGHDVDAYLRCSSHVCEPYAYDFVTKTEIALRRIRVPRRCEVTDLAIWREDIAYVVDQIGEAKCPARAVGVWLRTNKGARRLGNTRYSRIGSLTASAFGWSEWGGRYGTDARAYVTDPASSTRHLVAHEDLGYYDVHISATGPIIDGQSLYWATYGVSSVSESDDVTLYRRPVGHRQACVQQITHTDDDHHGVPHNWNEGLVDFAVDRGRLYYISNDALFEASTLRVSHDLKCHR